ncbi:hypothetical protein RRF57_010035 [Xylaria bambusicola]|uniref:Uncharacterized protein n=1 Tax=Xylaria bambusicola TaxID=326684 RepID=A0AAN7UWM6_9PEZI
MDRHLEHSAVPTAAVHNLDFAVREYLLLHDQHEELCQRLHQLSPSISLSWSQSSATTTTATTTTTTTTTTACIKTPSLASSTAVTSPSVSPTPSLFGRDSLSPSPQSDQRMMSHTWMPGSSSSSSRNRVHQQRQALCCNESEIAAGEAKLFDVNEGMKRALTELLNCEAIRQDKAMRTWVQTRLLETEKELRRGKRRRSSATTD